MGAFSIYKPGLFEPNQQWFIDGLAFPFVLPFAGFISPINIQCHTVTF
jgi:hypothetical protein